MASNRQDISFIRGETKTLRVTITDEDGELLNLTGSTVYFRLKQKITDADPAIILKDSGTPTDIEILLPQTTLTNTGRADIKLVPSDTSGLTPGKYVYDVWIALASGAEHTVVKPSVFFIEQAVTQLP